MTGSAKTTRREFLTKACELSAAGFVTASPGLAQPSRRQRALDA